MVLSDDFHCVMILQNRDFLIPTYSLHQATLNLKPSIICMVKDTKFTMPPFSVEIKFTILVLIEIHTPLHQVVDSCRCITDNMLYGFNVGDVVTCNHGVFNMLFEVIHLEVSH